MNGRLHQRLYGCGFGDLFGFHGASIGAGAANDDGPSGGSQRTVVVVMRRDHRSAVLRSPRINASVRDVCRLSISSRERSLVSLAV